MKEYLLLLINLMKIINYCSNENDKSINNLKINFFNILFIILLKRDLLFY